METMQKKEASKLLKEFYITLCQLPTTSFAWYISSTKMDWSSIREYYKLKKLLRLTYRSDEKIYPRIKRLPRNVWILKGGMFNTLYFILIPVSFFFYSFETYTVKGFFAFFYTAAFLLYFFSLRRLNLKSDALFYGIKELLEEIDGKPVWTINLSKHKKKR